MLEEHSGGANGYKKNKMFHQMCDVHRHLNNLPEKMIQPSLFFEHLQAQVQLHMASEGRNVSASFLLLVFVLENA